MAALCVLRGVQAPTASVLLHFAFPDRYPIIDWRALESLGEPEQATYPIPYWLRYTVYIEEPLAADRRSLRLQERPDHRVHPVGAVE
jgi:hypothetical protein